MDLCGYFCEWANEIKVRKFVSQQRIQKVSYCFFTIKNTPKLINQQLKNGVKIVDWQKKVSYCLFYCQKYLYLKLKNLVKIVN